MLRLEVRWLITKSGLVARRLVSIDASFAGSLACNREYEEYDVLHSLLLAKVFLTNELIAVKSLTSIIIEKVRANFMSTRRSPKADSPLGS